MRKEIVSLYEAGLSSIAISERIELPITTRQVQRIIKAAGATRTPTQARQVAIKSGRMNYKTKKPSIRKCPHCHEVLW